MIEHAAASFIIVLYGGVFKTQTKHHTLFGHWLNFLFLSSCLLLAGIQKMAAVCRYFYVFCLRGKMNRWCFNLFFPNAAQLFYDKKFCEEKCQKSVKLMLQSFNLSSMISMFWVKWKGLELSLLYHRGAWNKHTTVSVTLTE
ncbi:MAG: hypothetical protein ACOX0K_00355 [Oscillospiraceae bacterium]